MPMLRSVSWNRISRSNSVTCVPNGITQKARKPGNMARIGASRTRTVDGGRCDALLEEQLDAVGQGDQHATGPSAHRADACLHVGDRLALHPDVEHHGDQQGRRTRSRPARRGSSSRPSPSTVASRHGRRGRRARRPADGHGRLLEALPSTGETREREHLPGQQRVRREPRVKTARTPRRPRHSVTRTGSAASPASVRTSARSPSASDRAAASRVELYERLVLERRLQLVGPLGQAPFVDEQRVGEEHEPPVKASSSMAPPAWRV